MILPEHTQSSSSVRCEWGASGLAALAPISDVVVIVDVLSFSTCIDVVVARGARVYPYRWKDESARRYAETIDALCAGPRAEGSYSLSPVSLCDLPRGARLVLPSPNGSTLTLAAAAYGVRHLIAGSLRNAGAVARWVDAQRMIDPTLSIAVIPAGERWPDETLRPALEDWLGAGAVIARLTGTHSPEAAAAADAFRTHRDRLEETVRRCSSGQELVARGFADDVTMASEHDLSECVPSFDGEAYDAL